MTEHATTAQPGARGDLTEPAAEAARGADSVFGLGPFVGASGAEVVAAFQHIALEAIRRPWSGTEQYRGFRPRDHQRLARAI